MHFVKGLILLPSSSILLSDLALNNLYEAILSKWYETEVVSGVAMYIDLGCSATGTYKLIFWAPESLSHLQLFFLIQITEFRASSFTWHYSGHQSNR